MFSCNYSTPYIFFSCDSLWNTFLNNYASGKQIMHCNLIFLNVFSSSFGKFTLRSLERGLVRGERSLLWERFGIEHVILLMGMFLKIEVCATTIQASEVHLLNIFLTFLLVEAYFKTLTFIKMNFICFADQYLIHSFSCIFVQL